MSRYWAVPLAFAALFCSQPAHASPSYSSLLQDAMEMPCEPTCLVCHTKPEGGFASANTKLGITLRRQFGAECCDERALQSILAQLEAAALDSDGDGIPDIAELRTGTDPNEPTPEVALACRAKSDDGCSMSSRSASSSGATLLLLCLATMAVRWRTRRGRRTAWTHMR